MTITTDEARWTAVARRDRALDGTFFYSVRTTGVYCRPSCGARLPRRENVGYHVSSADAEAAGFRPCKRCRPNESPREGREATVVANACRAIESAETPLTLAALAEAAGFSRHHFHRMFKSLAGVTPKTYADAHRAKRVRDALTDTGSITEAIYDAGFGSSGRFYEQSDKVLGMTPTRYRARGIGATIRFAIGRCSLGSILVAATEKGVCAIFMGDDPASLTADLQRQFEHADLVAGDPEFGHVVAKVVALVEQPSRGLDLPLDIRGTAFQQRVWQALRDIRPGETVRYAEVAARIGHPKAVRAVAQACGANRLAVAIPCHRVVHKQGNQLGYRWGIERKRALLKRESAL